jgi:hypothetical protein
MSNAGILYLALFTAIFSSSVTYTITAKLCEGEQAALDSASEKNALNIQKKDDVINSQSENSYAKTSTDINALYVDSLPRTTSKHLPKLSSATAGTQSQSCVSKKYKLTLQQCDTVKAKAIALWDRDTALSQSR